jgi:hypothetical protein
MILGRSWNNARRALFAAVSVFALANAALGQLRSDHGEVLSGASVSNSHPAVGADDSGQLVAVVWDGLLDGARRIFLREKVAGEWLAEQVIDNAPLADNSSPVLDVDAAGTVHIAWLARVNGKLRVFYAFRTRSGNSVLWGAVNPDEPAGNSCDAVYLRADDEGRPWIAWQSGNASSYSISVAHLDPDEGQFRIDTLSTPLGAFNLFPQVFFQPEPMVVWYSASTSDFTLVGQRFEPEAGEWLPFAPAQLERMPGNKLPLLMDHADGTISGLWLEEVAFVDRVHLGQQGVETNGQGIVIDQRPAALNEQLSGAAGSERVLATWCSDDGTSGAQVYLAHGSELPFDELLVSDGEKRQYANPRLAALPGGAAVVYESAPINGDSGHIWYRDIAF